MFVYILNILLFSFLTKLINIDIVFFFFFTKFLLDCLIRVWQGKG